jgi:uncharacterized protein (UPF0276 family)
MEFALNYSPEGADLFQAGAIPLDRFKCPSDWPHMIVDGQRLGPVYVHFNLHVGRGLRNGINWDQIRATMHDTNTPYVNLHLAPRTTDFPDYDSKATDPATVAAIYDAMLQDLEAVIEQFGAEQVIVENIPADPRVMHAALLPNVIRRLVDETGCGFLLDISHARLSARLFGIEEYEYLKMMPCERLHEIHVTGIDYDSQGEIHDHMALTEADWPFVEWVLDQTRSGVWSVPWVMAFEYGGSGPLFAWRSESRVIAEQVPRLYTLAHSVEQGTI